MVFRFLSRSIFVLGLSRLALRRAAKGPQHEDPVLLSLILHTTLSCSSSRSRSVSILESFNFATLSLSALILNVNMIAASIPRGPYITKRLPQ